MPIEEGVALPNLLTGFNAALLLKAFVMLFVIFYAVFALILFRQIQLMDRAIPTPIGPFLKFVGILQIGVALGFMFIIIGLF